MNILFVDDEDDIRDLIEVALSIEEDVEASFAATGQQAIDTIDARPFDVIMLDVMMPPPDGLEVLRFARGKAAQNGAVIVMCTAKTSAEAEMEFRALGADHVLHKPFKPLLLAGYLRGLAARNTP